MSNTAICNSLELSASTRSFVSFSVGEQLFGIDILLVREINRQLDISIVPQAPSYVRGLINLRGQIVTVVDLSYRLGRTEHPLSPLSHNIIIKNEAELSLLRSQQEFSDLNTTHDSVGLLVDSIGEVVRAEEDTIEPAPANMGLPDGQFVTGVIQLENRLMAILNIAKVLEPGRL